MIQNISLSNKWRPKSLNDIIGQDQTIYTIKNMIKYKNILQSYIIIGQNGIGKTSFARILTKCLNCKIGITDNPCNKCSCCKNIDSNLNIDSIEIDAASNTKFDDIKDLLELSKYKNLFNRYKTFIIDECHMLSNNSFNCLLKKLEEPEKNVIYILVTTEIDKIPPTVISRCINFRLNKLSQKNIKTRLAFILEKENIFYDPYVLEYISIFSDGSMRYAINTLEKTINLFDKKISIDNTRIILGIVPEINIMFILKSILEKNIEDILKLILEFNINNIEYKNIIHQIQIVLYKIFLYKNCINYDKNISKYKIFVFLSKNLTCEHIIKFNKILLKNLKYLNFVVDKDLAFKMIIFKMIFLKDDC
jgi:DNA polymerase III subunit gamma/tau